MFRRIENSAELPPAAALKILRLPAGVMMFRRIENPAELPVASLKTAEVLLTPHTSHTIPIL
jgi:hypothetical protein